MRSCKHCHYQQCHEGECRNGVRLFYFTPPLVVYKIIYHDVTLRNAFVTYDIITYDMNQFSMITLLSFNHLQIDSDGKIDRSIVKKQTQWCRIINHIIDCFMLLKQIVIDDLATCMMTSMYHCKLQQFQSLPYDYEYRCIGAN